MTTTAEVQSDVRAWLEAEHEYQFAKNLQTHRADPDSSLHHIMEAEIPNKWDRFRYFHSKWWPEGEVLLQMQASQQLLKVAAAARAAFVWSGVTEGDTVDQSSAQSWELLSQYERDVASNSAGLPAREDLFADTVPIDLYLPAGREELGRRFTYFGGLATTHLVEAVNCQGIYIMPRAGVSSGN